MPVTIPPPDPRPFTPGIAHPDLYLWDAWSYVEAGGAIHLYSLATGRRLADGSPLAAGDRNSVPFHIRHFLSRDDGLSWTDQGCLIEPRRGAGLADSLTLWSGGIEPLEDGWKLLAYTGLHDFGPERPFAQNIMLALSDGYTVAHRPEAPVLCPVRDWQAITDAGYYLPDPAEIGHRDGEGGGPILAWRDPFPLIDADGRIHLFWSAKTAPRRAAMGHAIIRRDGTGFELETLLPPVTVPDEQEFTQFELPKVYVDDRDGSAWLVASTCSRLYEKQPDAEVDKTIRVYRAGSIDGPWQPWGPEGSAVPGLGTLFGMTVLRPDFTRNRFLCMSPHTDAAGEAEGLTFAPAFRLDPATMTVIDP